MLTTCSKCRDRYDDTRCTTICPHEAFLSQLQALRKDVALQLLGRLVVFNHRPAGVPPARVTSVDWDGMVTLDGWDGKFAPHLFSVAVAVAVAVMEEGPG